MFLIVLVFDQVQMAVGGGWRRRRSRSGRSGDRMTERNLTPVAGEHVKYLLEPFHASEWMW